MKEDTITTAKSELLRIISDLESGQGLRRVIYKGKCMSPTLRDEDLLFVQPCAIEDVRFGDIVVYRCSETIRVHRFILRNKASIVTTPDNTCREPERCFREDLIGRVLLLRRDGKVVNFSSFMIQVLSFYRGTRSLIKYLLFNVIYRRLKQIRSCMKGFIQH
jgi:hypothetical protein